MNQSAQCLNCEAIFETPAVVLGKTAIVLCRRCRKPVVVKGELDPAEAPTGPIERSGAHGPEEDSHAWRVRSEYDRPVVEREKEPQSPVLPEVPKEALPIWKMAGAAMFMLACVAFMLVRIFYVPTPDVQTLARIDASQNAFAGIAPVMEGGTPVAVISDAHGRALAGVPERQICANAIFQGVMATRIRTENGKPVADCSSLARPRR